jgi:hypothetical protein
MTKEEWLNSLSEGDDGTGFEGDEAQYTCEKCKKDFEDDDIVWANQEGQLSQGRNEFVWCVPCLPAQVMICGDHLVEDCGCRI